MGAAHATRESADVHYAIRLEPEQSLALYGLLRPKRTLAWPDVVCTPKITLSACVTCGIPPERLHRLQPDIREWIRLDRATVADCKHMGPWRPHPFTDLGCRSIGDLIIHRAHMPPQLVIDSGLTFRELRELHGLTPDAMVLLKYTTDDWVHIGLPADYLPTIPDALWRQLFGGASRNDLAALIARGSPGTAPLPPVAVAGDGADPPPQPNNKKNA